MTPAVTLLAHATPQFEGTWRLLRNNQWKGVDGVVVWAPKEKSRLAAQWALLTLLTLSVGWQASVAVMVVPFGVVGLIFYAFSQVSHINSDSFLPPQTKEWAAHQIATTRGDCAYESLLWNRVSGGNNNQAFHHCFPTVHPCHFPALSRLLRPVFVKHGLPLHGWEQSYWESLSSHIGHLYKLNAAS